MPISALSRFLAEAPWREGKVHRWRIRFRRWQTKPQRQHRSLVVLEDTLGEHVGSLFEYVDRHYRHGDGTYPLAHNPVTRFNVSGPVGFPVVVFDAWYLAEDLVSMLAQRRKDGISLLKKHRLLETASFHLRNANGWPRKLSGPHLAVEELVPLIPANAYCPVNVRAQSFWCVTLAVRIPSLGKVRPVVSFEQESLTGLAVVLVPNRVDWSAAKIIGLYLQRWLTEPFFQGSKGQLGFNA